VESKKKIEESNDLVEIEDKNNLRKRSDSEKDFIKLKSQMNLPKK